MLHREGGMDSTRVALTAGLALPPEGAWEDLGVWPPPLPRKLLDIDLKSNLAFMQHQYCFTTSLKTASGEYNDEGGGCGGGRVASSTKQRVQVKRLGQF